ncbi:MAG: paraquat-inducible protein A [bacterium]
MNNKLSSLLSFVLTALIIPALLYLAWQSYQFAMSYVEDTQTMVTESSLEPKIVDKLKQMAETLTFEYYTGHSENLKRHRGLVTEAEKHQKASFNMMYAFFAVGIGGIFLLQFVCKSHLAVVTTLVMLSMLSLIVGLMAPTLIIVGLKSVPVIDEAVVFYQSKGIFSTIYSVLESGGFLVAGLLILFSVVVPLLKTAVIGVGLLVNNHRSRKAAKLMNMIGKWSMADVFVVALILSYFVVDGGASIEDTIQTSAELQVGIYFFSAYVLLSMFGTVWVNRRHSRVG